MFVFKVVISVITHFESPLIPLREWAKHPSLWRSSIFDYFHSLPFSHNHRQALLQWSIECGVALLLTYRDEAGALESSDPQREFCPYIFMFFFVSRKIAVDALEFCSWTLSQHTGQFPKKFFKPLFPQKYARLFSNDVSGGVSKTDDALCFLASLGIIFYHKNVIFAIFPHSSSAMSGFLQQIHILSDEVAE